MGVVVPWPTTITRLRTAHRPAVGGATEEVVSETITGTNLDRAVEADQVAYKESVRLSSAALTEYLLDKVGQRITTVGVGLSDARQVRKWAAGSPIRPSNEERLQLLYRIARTVELVYDQETARAFLRSRSPYLGNKSPLQAIAEMDEQGALEAVRYLLEP
jgi:uncharacterized protein (DUF2384 family)